MWNLLKMNFIIEKLSKKNIVAFLFVAVLVIGLAVYMENEDVGNLVAEKTAEHQNLIAAVNQYQVLDATEESDSSDIYKNIVQQKKLVALQRAATNMDRPDLFVDSAIELAELRKNSFNLEGYEDVAIYLPTKTENELEMIFYDHLKELDFPIFTDSLSFYQFLIFLFVILGSFWYIFLAFFTSGIMIDDFRHTSLIKGYPILFNQYITAKGLSTIVIIFVLIIELFLCSLPLIFIRGLGDASYPVAVFDGNFEIYSIVQYIGICLLYMICIGIFVILLSIILNVLLKNMYLTLFVQLFLYVLPLIYPRIISLLPYNPFNYMNFTSLLSGQSLDLAYPVVLNANYGLITIVISSLLMVIAIRLFLSAGKLKRV